MRIYLNLCDLQYLIDKNIIKEIYYASLKIIQFCGNPHLIYCTSVELLDYSKIFQQFLKCNSLLLDKSFNSDIKNKEKKIFEYLKYTEYYDSPEFITLYITNNSFINKVSNFYLNRTVFLKKYDMIILDGSYGKKTEIYHFIKDKIINL